MPDDEQCHSTRSYLILRLRQGCQQHWEESELLVPLTSRSRAKITIALSLLCVSCTTTYIQLHRCLTDHHQSMSVSHCDNVRCVYSYLFQGGMAAIFGGSTLLITILHNELIFTLIFFTLILLLEHRSTNLYNFSYMFCFFLPLMIEQCWARLSNGLLGGHETMDMFRNLAEHAEL